MTKDIYIEDNLELYSATDESIYAIVVVYGTTAECLRSAKIFEGKMDSLHLYKETFSEFLGNEQLFALLENAIVSLIKEGRGCNISAFAFDLNFYQFLYSRKKGKSLKKGEFESVSEEYEHSYRKNNDRSGNLSSHIPMLKLMAVARKYCLDTIFENVVGILKAKKDSETALPSMYDVNFMDYRIKEKDIDTSISVFIDNLVVINEYIWGRLHKVDNINELTENERRLFILWLNIINKMESRVVMSNGDLKKILAL